MLPGDVSNLHNLQILALRDNDLLTLPRELGQLARIKELHLQGFVKSEGEREKRENDRLKEREIESENERVMETDMLVWISEIYRDGSKVYESCLLHVFQSHITKKELMINMPI